MVKKMSKYLVLTAVIAAVALFAAVEAGAVICQAPDETFPLEPDSDGVYVCPPGLENLGCCVTLTDDLEKNWVVEVVPDESTSVFPDYTPKLYNSVPEEALCTDNRGNEITATGFTYLVHSPADAVLTHLGVSYPATGCEINKICPKDQSTKFSDSMFDGWLGDTPHLNAAYTSAIKSIASDKGVASFGTSFCGADIGSIHLVTDNGSLTGEILTMSCCEKAHVAGSRTIGDIQLTFDTCSGDLINIADLSQDGDFIPVRGFICEATGDSPNIIIDEKSCHEILKGGPEASAFLNLCIQYSNFVIKEEDVVVVDRSGDAGKMTTLVGFGSDMFLGPVVPGTDCSNDPYAHQTTISPQQSATTCQSEIVYDGVFQVNFDCDESSATFNQPKCACLPPQESPCTNETYDSGVCRPFVQLGGSSGDHVALCVDKDFDTKGKIVYEECSLVVDGGLGSEGSVTSNCYSPWIGYYFSNFCR